jgi:hypothetical protein
MTFIHTLQRRSGFVNGPSGFRLARGVTLFLLFCAPVTALSANAVAYHYDPAVVTLTGVIETQTFPGRTGYESIANGDEIERGWYLRLARSIVVEPNPDENGHNSSRERNVKVVQLAFIDNDQVIAVLPRLEGKRAVLTGKLFHAFSAHHHARVLFDVQTVSAAAP